MATPRQVLALMLIAAPVALGSMDAAATTTYTLPNYCNPNGSFMNGSLVTSNSPYTNAPGTCAASGAAQLALPLTQISAWSNTGSGGLLQSAYVGDYGTTNGLGATSTAGRATSPTGTLGSGNAVDNYNDGITAETTVAPDHAMDNNGNTESILLSFNTAITLTSFSIGYSNTDSDMSVLRYTGTGCVGGCSTDLTTLTYSTLTTKGWAWVGNYANVVVGSNTSTGLSPSASNVSSYWLIAAYNSVFGTGTGLTDGNDYVKLLSVTTDIPSSGGKVPEPSSVLLVGIAMAGLAASRKRLALSR